MHVCVCVCVCVCVRACVCVKYTTLTMSYIQLDFPDEHIIDNITSLLEGVANHRRNLSKSKDILCVYTIIE